MGQPGGRETRGGGSRRNGCGGPWPANKRSVTIDVVLDAGTRPNDRYATGIWVGLLIAPERED